MADESILKIVTIDQGAGSGSAPTGSGAPAGTRTPSLKQPEEPGKPSHTPTPSTASEPPKSFAQQAKEDLRRDVENLLKQQAEARATPIDAEVIDGPITAEVVEEPIVDAAGSDGASLGAGWMGRAAVNVGANVLRTMAGSRGASLGGIASAAGRAAAGTAAAEAGGAVEAGLVTGGAATALGGFTVALGVAAAGLAATAAVAYAASAAVEDMADSIRGVSANVAGAEGIVEVNRILSQIKRDELIGSSLGENVMLRGKIETTLYDIKTILAGPLVEAVNEGLRGILLLVETAAQFAGSPMGQFLMKFSVEAASAMNIPINILRLLGKIAKNTDPKPDELAAFNAQIEAFFNKPILDPQFEQQPNRGGGIAGHGVGLGPGVLGH